ncbi:hypothetical protein ACHAXT_011910 [Thalassiosira profunda]
MSTSVEVPAPPPPPPCQLDGSELISLHDAVFLDVASYGTPHDLRSLILTCRRTRPRITPSMMEEAARRFVEKSANDEEREYMSFLNDGHDWMRRYCELLHFRSLDPQTKLAAELLDGLLDGEGAEDATNLSPDEWGGVLEAISDDIGEASFLPLAENGVPWPVPGTVLAEEGVARPAPEEERERELLSDQESDSDDRVLASYRTTPTKGKKKKRKKKKQKQKKKTPKRPVRPLILFQSEVFPRLKEEHPGKDWVELHKMMCDKWKLLCEEEKQSYSNRYKEEMKAYHAANSPSANAPKRPLSSYMLFNNEMRPRLKEEHPEKDEVALAKLIGARWQLLREEEKQVYSDRYKENKKAYDAANPVAASAPTVPKRPLTSYMLFQHEMLFNNEMHPRLKEEHQGKSMSELTKLMSDKWRSMGDEEKRQYSDRYEENKRAYDAEMAGYTAKPSACRDPSEDYDVPSEHHPLGKACTGCGRAFERIGVTLSFVNCFKCRDPACQKVAHLKEYCTKECFELNHKHGLVQEYLAPICEPFRDTNHIKWNSREDLKSFCGKEVFYFVVNLIPEVERQNMLDAQMAGFPMPTYAEMGNAVRAGQSDGRALRRMIANLSYNSARSVLFKCVVTKENKRVEIFFFFVWTLMGLKSPGMDTDHYNLNERIILWSIALIRRYNEGEVIAIELPGGLNFDINTFPETTEFCNWWNNPRNRKNHEKPRVIRASDGAKAGKKTVSKKRKASTQKPKQNALKKRRTAKVTKQDAAALQRLERAAAARRRKKEKKSKSAEMADASRDAAVAKDAAESERDAAMRNVGEGDGGGELRRSTTKKKQKTPPGQGRGRRRTP